MKRVLEHIGKAVLAIVCAVVLFYAGVIAVLLLTFDTAFGEIYSCVILAFGILAELTVIGALWGFLKRKAVYLPIFIAYCLCVLSWISVWGYETYLENIPTVGESDNLLYAYAPYAEGTKAVTLDEESTLLIEKDLPVMDGATALYPIYSSFAKAVYPKELIDGKTEFLKCTTTSNAYYNIVTGDADIIFVALPSAEQEEFPKENGVELVFTPIGKEAFVFFVNAQNPIEDVSLSDIQQIYSGNLTEWETLGVKGLGKIKAFQRDKGSGSQSTLEKLMAGYTLMIPPKENVIDGMGGIIEQTADYKNFKNAMGYSFRFYSTEMVQNNQIKLLSVNGVYPSRENIENGTYPLASHFYAVTRSDADENVQKLLDWITSEQGIMTPV